ncbi:MAG: GntR family transcriptional regulator, partial [Clostridia bacterium]|nr:GntR family transcriptional regulator [Clostridia bacterium]
MDNIFNLQLDPSQEVPIYRQIVDAVTAEVRSGRMEYGTKLPTVRDLSSALDIAIGTIKRAYDELEASGIISKARGRGTFVSWTDDNSRSRKDRAMDAIDSTLDLMEELRFSQTEISISLDLKMRERKQRLNGDNVAAVECC